jgi:hypothetical protein
VQGKTLDARQGTDDLGGTTRAIRAHPYDLERLEERLEP